MRLPLPPAFPDVDLPPDMAARMVVTTLRTGLPGTDLLVFHPNNYGLVLIHGRTGTWCDDCSVEAVIVRVRNRESGLWLPATDTKIRTTGGGTIQGWADAAWLAAALTHLATL